MAAPTAAVLDARGARSREVALAEPIFAAELKPHLIHETVRAELNAQRAGTFASKSRGLVSGGRSKPWRQKGTGRARAGTIRAGQFTGGGHIFAKVPRSFELKVNRKAQRAAYRSALAEHVGASTFALLDTSGFDTPSTKQAAALIAAAGLSEPLVVVLTDAEVVAAKSFRNLERVAVVAPSELEARRHRLGTLAACERGGPAAARGAGELMHAGQIVLAPIVSEKSYHGSVNGTYTFRVHNDAHKTQIRQAVEELFEVNVLRVNVIKVQPKPKRRGQIRGMKPGWKKAIVQLKPGQTIEVFQGAQL